MLVQFYNRVSFPKGTVLTSNEWNFEIINSFSFLYPLHILGIILQDGTQIAYPRPYKPYIREWFKEEGELSFEEMVQKIRAHYDSNPKRDSPLP